jgi:hypothetical protein
MLHWLHASARSVGAVPVLVNPFRSIYPYLVKCQAKRSVNWYESVP